MATRTLTLVCDTAVKNLLCRAIREYAHAAYPEGGSECAQVARYTLLEAAAQIEVSCSDDGGEAQVSRRLRSQLKAALEYYFDRRDAETSGTSRHQRELLATLFGGEAVTAAGLEAAAALDRPARE